MSNELIKKIEDLADGNVDVFYEDCVGQIQRVKKVGILREDKESKNKIIVIS